MVVLKKTWAVNELLYSENLHKLRRTCVSETSTDLGPIPAQSTGAELAFPQLQLC